jgi:hypothetical protein
MRQDLEPIFPAHGLLIDLHPRLEDAGYRYRIELMQYIPDNSNSQPGLNLPHEAGLCEVRAYTGEGLEPLLMLVYAHEGEFIPTGCLLRRVEGIPK